MHLLCFEPVMVYLLDLPRELRDEMYKYVFFDSEGFHVRIGKENKVVCLQKLHEENYRKVNQLKYVSRQLLEETRNLEIQGRLHFADQAESSAIEQCARFLFSTSAHWGLISQLSIKTSIKQYQTEQSCTNLARIEEFCRRHPRIMVRLHAPYWSQQHPSFILSAISLSIMLRANTFLLQELSFLPISEIVQNWFEDEEYQAIMIELPPNLRLFPCDDKFNEEAFVLTCCEIGLLDSVPKRDTKKLVKVALRCFDHGV
jgi:hypothetical protein